MGKDMTRITSAIVMILAVVGLVLLGPKASFVMLLIVGTLVSDELLVNFIRVKRFSSSYFIALVVFITPIVGFFFLSNSKNFSNQIIVHLCLLMNVGLLFYLFSFFRDEFKLTNFLAKVPFLVGIYAFFNIFSLSHLFFHQSWWQLLTVLLFITYGMDTGAWFVGKNFGKNKLWPAVSPNKTIEGLVGGMLLAGTLGGAAFHFVFGDFYISQFFIFCLLGGISQLGDLLQSKIKREAGIKDSSSLIPGHGGVFDRVDSLFFLTPFYLVLIQYYLS